MELGCVILISKLRGLFVDLINDEDVHYWKPGMRDEGLCYYFRFGKKYRGIELVLPKNIIILCAVPNVLPMEIIENASIILGPEKFKESLFSRGRRDYIILNIGCLCRLASLSGILNFSYPIINND